MQASAGSVALMALRRGAYAFSQSPGLAKFRPDWPLQGLGNNGIPVAVSDGVVSYGSIAATHYTIDLRAYRQQLHPQLNPTLLWGYGQNGLHRHLGGVIVAQKNTPVQITFRNYLQLPHPVASAIDRTGYFIDAGMYPDNRVSVHLHGGFTPWITDGEPESWFSPAGGPAGPTYSPDMAQFASVSAGFAEYYWPNQQSSRLMWYHDHAMDITRVNAYGGLASGYILRDDVENSLIRVGAIPSREVPLVFQDKVFNSDGSLWYPYQYEATGSKGKKSNPSGRWDQGPALNHNALASHLKVSCVPEYFGDTILCNGTAYPSVTVSQNRYRFRILNAFQARFMNLTLWKIPSGMVELPLKDDGKGMVLSTSPFTVAPNWVPAAQPGPKMIQIATEGGFLKAPATFAGNLTVGFDQNPASPTFNNVNQKNLVLAPAERADILIDFSGCKPGDRIVLWNDAPAPFPGGDPRNDYYFGQPDFTDPNKNQFGLAGGSASPMAGFGPNTRTLLQFTVSAGSGGDMPEPGMMAVLSAQMANAFTTLDPKTAVRVRELTLNEDYDAWGRLIQRLGTDQIAGQPVMPPDVANPSNFAITPIGDATYGRAYLEPVTEMPGEGDVEIWRIWNRTGDTHPIHFHLINVQILSREAFDGEAPLSGKPLAPAFQGVDPNELGWKETVRVNPCEAITVIAKFDLPQLPFQIPLSTRAGNQTPGHQYVWHCHILEHEEHDMMRPLVVIPK